MYMYTQTYIACMVWLLKLTTSTCITATASLEHYDENAPGSHVMWSVHVNGQVLLRFQSYVC